MCERFYTKKSEVEDKPEEIEIDQLYEDVGNSRDNSNCKGHEKGQLEFDVQRRDEDEQREQSDR